MSEAKHKLSELVTRATTEGLQTIRRHDTAGVVLSEEIHRGLTGEKPSFRDWILNGPRIDDLSIPAHDQSTVREIDF